MFYNFNVYHWNRFLTNIVNKEHTDFYTLKMVSGKKAEISVERDLDLSFLFTSKNVASGYTLCDLENCFFLLYVGFKNLTPKSIISPVNWNIEKNTTMNTEGLKSGIKRINMKMT